MIHVLPWFFRVFCFDRFSEPLQRCPWAWRMDPLPSYIHNLTNWTNLCVCVAKKRFTMQKCPKNIEHYWILYTISYYYKSIIYYWQWLRDITSTSLSNSLSSLLSLDRRMGGVAPVLTLLTEALGQLLQAFLHDLHLLAKQDVHQWLLLWWKCCYSRSRIYHIYLNLSSIKLPRKHIVFCGLSLHMVHL